jgi:hypothetical protein
MPGDDTAMMVDQLFGSISVGMNQAAERVIARRGANPKTVREAE